METLQTGVYQQQLKRALLALKKMQAKVRTLENKQHESIAIVGMGCRLPGGVDSPEALWQLLDDEIDAISEVPADRWDIEHYYDADPDAAGKMLTRFGGFLDNIDAFDPAFFGISPSEALSLDPQQRLLLEVTWEALEHASIAPESLKDSQTAVFLGMSSSEYAQLLLERDVEDIDSYLGSGNAHSAAVGRLSYILGLLAPSLAIDTACSSSLVAVHLACQSLRQGECDLAITGGVNALLAPFLSINHSRAKMLAPDGRCKTFDAAADGFVRSEGCGIVILKRLSDVNSRDQVLAVIRGSAVNQDGHTSGLTVPNGPSQQAVIRKALANAQLSAEQVSYIEAHGTGTSLGDPIEMEALKAVFSDAHAEQKSLAVGSLKTNIGHLEAAAGIAGLMKVILSLQHQKIPAHLHFKQANKHLDLDNFPGKISTKAHDWQPLATSRVAGVSSFGFGGTNAHVLLEEATPYLEKIKRTQRDKILASDRALIERTHHIFTLSAKSKTALNQLVQRYQEYLDQHDNISIENICYSVTSGRSHFSERLAIVVDSVEGLKTQLSAFINAKHPMALVSSDVFSHTHINSDTESVRIAFLFTGQGSQYPKMAWTLYQSQPLFRRILQRCDQLLEKQLPCSLVGVLYTSEDNETVGLIDETAYTQPVIFAIEYALAQLWLSWGVKPDYVIGHSIGEYVAACIAGVFSLEDALKLVTARGHLMQQHCQKGAMLALGCSDVEAQVLIKNTVSDVSIAAVNAAHQVVVSGQTSAIQTLQTHCEQHSIRCKRLAVSHAFHSKMMQPMLLEFERIAQQIHYAAPQIELISTLTGKLIENEIASADYWVKHVRQPVLFAQASQCLLATGCEVSIEVGAKPILTGMMDQTPEITLTSLRQDKADWSSLLGSLARLYTNGFNPDWLGFDQHYSRQRLPLPTYPFQRQSYWFTPTAPTPIKKQSPPAILPTDLPTYLSTEIADCLYELQWQAQDNKNILALNQTVAVTEKQPSKYAWLIFIDQHDLKSHLQERLLLLAKNEAVIWVFAGQQYQQQDAENFILNPEKATDFQQLFKAVGQLSKSYQVLYAWGLNASDKPEPQLAETAEWLSIGLLSLLQTLLTIKNKQSTRLWLLSYRTQHCLEQQEDILGLAQSPLWGVGKNIALEYPTLWGGAIDLESLNHTNTALCLDEILHNDGEDLIAFRQDKRYVQRLKSVDKILDKQLLLPVKISSQALYLITGGLGAFGLKTAEYLLVKGAKHLVLLGRSAKISDEIQDWLKHWKNKGADIQVLKVDVANKSQMQSLFLQLKQAAFPLRGIIHAAGTPGYSTLNYLRADDMTQMFSAKVMGSCLLSELSAELPLDFFVACSSMVSVWGAKGQAHYVAANAFMDSLMHDRHLNNLAGLSINWGPMTGGGMLTTETAHDLSQMGVHTLDMQQCVALMFEQLINTKKQITVANIDWSILQALYQQHRAYPLLDVMADKSTVIDGTCHGEDAITLPIQQQLEQLVVSERQDFLWQALIQCLADTLGFANIDAINPKQGFFDMGMDSLTAMVFRNQLQERLQLPLPATLAFDYSSIMHLGNYLMDEVLTCAFQHEIDDSLMQSQTEYLLDVKHVTPVLDDLPNDSIERLLREKLNQLDKV